MPGEVAQLSLAGTAGQVVSLQVTKVNFTPLTYGSDVAYLKVLAPNGKDIVYGTAALSNRAEGPFSGPITLPDSGTYLVKISGYDRNTGSFTVRLTSGQ